MKQYNFQAYLDDLDNMHKVVLEAKDEDQLKVLADQLKEGAIDHKLWVEQPENYPTWVDHFLLLVWTEKCLLEVEGVFVNSFSVSLCKFWLFYEQ